MIDEKYLELFLDEVTEHIDDLNRSLLELEQDKENPEIINEIFRVAHTLKSSAGFVGLEYLSRLAHRMEDLFQLIKDKKIQVNTELMNLLFSCLDAIKKAVANVQDNKDEDKDALNELVHQIDQFVEYELKSRPQDIEPKKEEVKKEIPSAEEIPEQKVPKIELEISEEEKKQLLELIAPQDHVYVGHVLIDSDASMKNLRLLLIYNRLARIASVFKLDPTIDQLEKNSNIDKLSFVIYGNISKDQIVRLCQIDLVEEISVKEVELKKSAIVDVTSKIPEKAPTQQTATVQKKQEKDVQDLSENIIKSRNIKVDSRKIDYIINNVGELVITNSGLQKIYEDLLEEYGESQIISDLRSKIDQAIRIARELQSGVMKMRMMPIGIVFQRFFRPVRDLSLSLGKKVELKIFGEDTELDKNIIDSLNDPLMHLIRNAVDHGIEPPEERLKKGKPEVGTVILRSYQSGNHIFIEVQDDGRGLNKEKIYNKALSLGLVKDKENLTDQEIYEFIFYPGFSTATQVSNVSGRGVGMNVVKEVINEFKGAVKIQTEPEKGTTFILMFPLTLAIISTIHVKIENEEYAFPLSDVVETIRILPSQITKLQGKNIINLRKEIVPIYELSVLMGLPSKLNDILVPEVENNNDNIKNEFPIVITSVANKKIGFIVEEMIGKKEIVIKSLDQNYKNIPGLIGACLLGDGSIVMVLDVNGLIEIATKNYEEQLSLTKTNEEVRKAIQNYNKKVVELTRITKHTKKKVIVNKKIPETPSEKTIIVENKKETPIQQSQTQQVNENIPTNATKIVEVNKDVLIEFEKDKERRKEIGLKVYEDVVNNNVIVKENNKEIPAFVGKSTDIKSFLSEKDYEKLYSIVNSGMVNAGLVLSQLLGVTIDVSVPEFKTIEYHEIQEIIKDTTHYNIFLETTGEFESLLTLFFDEEMGINTAAELMGIPVEQRNKEKIDLEDIKSVLNELTNIVGSSLLNEVANKSGMAIKPSVPEFYIVNKNELIRLIENKKHPHADEKIIYISADFLRDETELLGKLLLLPSKPNLIQLIEKLK